MRVTVDHHSPEVGYADFRDGEEATEEKRTKAFERATELGATQVEIWTNDRWAETWGWAGSSWKKIR